jgi:hypothetical protein
VRLRTAVHWCPSLNCNASIVSLPLSEFHRDRAQQLQLELAEAREHAQAAAEQQLVLQQQVTAMRPYAAPHMPIRDVSQVSSLKQSLAASETGSSTELLRLQEAAQAAADKAAVSSAAADALERDKAALTIRVEAAETELLELNAAVRPAALDMTAAQVVPVCC